MEKITPNQLSKVMEWLPPKDLLQAAQVSRLFEQAVARSVRRGRPGWESNPLGCLKRRLESEAGTRLMDREDPLYLEGFKVAAGAKIMPHGDDGYILIEGQVLTEVCHGAKFRPAANEAGFPEPDIHGAGKVAQIDGCDTLKRAAIVNRQLRFSLTGWADAERDVRRHVVREIAPFYALVSSPVLFVPFILACAAGVSASIARGVGRELAVWEGLNIPHISFGEMITEAKRFTFVHDGSPFLVESVVGKVMVTNLRSGVVQTLEAPGRALVTLSSHMRRVPHVGIANGKTFSVLNLLTGEQIHSRELSAPITALVGSHQSYGVAFALRADQLYIDDLKSQALVSISLEANPLWLEGSSGYFRVITDDDRVWQERWGWRPMTRPPGKLWLEREWVDLAESPLSLLKARCAREWEIVATLKSLAIGTTAAYGVINLAGLAINYGMMRRRLARAFFDEMRYTPS
jgi:hypothetical protein